MSAPSDGVEENMNITEKTALDIIKTWSLNSPTHGIRRISRANSTFERLFWTLTFLTFTILMCMFIYTVVMKFATHPAKISLTLATKRISDHAPTVTFCNLNPLRSTVFPNKNQSQPPINCTHVECINTHMSEYLAENRNGNQSATSKIGYKLNELLIQCTFNGQSCNKNFSKFFHPTYGNCYTFKHPENHTTFARKDVTRLWSIADENSGDVDRLLLELYVFQNEYIPFLEDRTGFRIFIHRKNELPILSQNSLFLAPGTFTRLIYSQRMIRFTQQCRKNLTDDMTSAFNSNSVQYSQTLCHKICELLYIERQYSCIDPYFLVLTQFFSRNRTEQMRSTPLCPYDRAYRDNSYYFNPETNCSHCLPECELIQYTIQPSYADYPNMRSEDIVFNRIEKHLKAIGYNIEQSNIAACANNRRDTMLGDVIAVEISASPYATEVLTRSPMYTWVDLISSIGGQTGLWIGVSLISFVEIAELLLLLSCYFIKTIFGKICDRWKS